MSRISAGYRWGIAFMDHIFARCLKKPLQTETRLGAAMRRQKTTDETRERQRVWLAAEDFTV